MEEDVSFQKAKFQVFSFEGFQLLDSSRTCSQTKKLFIFSTTKKNLPQRRTTGNYESTGGPKEGLKKKLFIQLVHD